jgi:hypothetical protein
MAAAGSGHNVVSGGEESAEDIFHEAASTTDEEDEFRRREHRSVRVHRGLLRSLEEDDEEDRAYDQWDPYSNPSHADDLYDENLDDEDEAYVYKNMRGGVRESVTVLQQHSQQETNSTTTRTAASPQKKQLQMYKPRGTDAVLSCPCCFNIVCMDCQRHSKYANQFRAIFVMGIAVHWHKILVYDQRHQALVPKVQQQLEHSLQDNDSNPPTQRHHPVPHEEEDGKIEHEATLSLSWLDEPIHSPSTIKPPKTKEGEYFAVECANYQTQVSVLDMMEEVYHFHGCLESSPSV